MPSIQPILYHTRPDLLNLQAKTDRALDELIKKVSLFAILSLMNPRLQQALSSEIVQEACETDRSICTIYLEKAGNDLWIWNRLYVRLIYFIAYVSGIIPNGVNAIAKMLLEKVRHDPVFKNYKMVFSHVDRYLTDYQLAAKEYNEGRGTGSRDDYLSARLAMPTDTICNEFCDTVLKELLPQHIPFIDMSLTYPLDVCLNFLVKAILKKQLPSLIKYRIESIEKSTFLKDLSISITKNLLAQLRVLKAHDLTAARTPGSVPEQFPQLISKLFDALTEEPHKTQKEFGGNGIKIPSINEVLQKLIVNASHPIFSNLSNPEKSEELFYQVLTASSKAITAKAPSPSTSFMLHQLKRKMRREIKGLIQTNAAQALPEGSAFSLAVGAGAAVLSAAVIYKVGPAAAPILGGAAGILLSLRNHPTAKKTSLLVGALFGAASSFIPSIAPMTFAAMAMEKKIQKAAVSTLTEACIIPPVMDVIDDLYDFLLQKHFWKWAVIDSMDMLNDSYRK